MNRTNRLLFCMALILPPLSLGVHAFCVPQQGPIPEYVKNAWGEITGWFHRTFTPPKAPSLECSDGVGDVVEDATGTKGAAACGTVCVTTTGIYENSSDWEVNGNGTIWGTDDNDEIHVSGVGSQALITGKGGWVTVDPGAGAEVTNTSLNATIAVKGPGVGMFEVVGPGESYTCGMYVPCP